MALEKQLKSLKQTYESAEGDYAETISELESLINETEARPELRDICLRIISKSPKEHRVRLVLAKLFYLDGMGEHCVRELIHLQRLLGDNPAIGRLLESFREYAYSIPGIVFEQSTESGEVLASGEEEVAELDIDVDFGEALDDLDDDDS